MSRSRFFVLVGLPIAALFFCPLLIRKRSMPITSHGKVIGTVNIAFALTLNDNFTDVYVGQSRVFSLRHELTENPYLVYPLDDGHQFLCVYNNDIENLVFVVDLNLSATNMTPPPSWVPFVVRNNQGIVRSPTKSELQKTIAELTSLTPKDFRRVSFPHPDLGFYRRYDTQDFVTGLLLKAFDGESR